MKTILGMTFVATLAAVAEASPPSVRTVTGIAYANRPRCVLDVRVPDRATNFPTVVWLHGGALSHGARHFVNLSDAGIAQVAVDYRLLGEDTDDPEDCIADAAEAVAWTLAHIGGYGGDTNRVFVAGHSAGGYLSMMIGMDPKWLAAHGVKNIDLAGLIPISGQATKHFNVRRFSGDNDPQYLPKIDSLAPLAHVSATLPPILSICGQPPYEWKARAEENRLLVASCEALGHPSARYLELPLCDHARVAVAALQLRRIIRVLIDHRAAAVPYVSRIVRAGISGLICDDFGTARMALQVAPKIPVFASERLGFRTVPALRAAALAGFKRVYLPADLSAAQLAELAVNPPVELGVTLYGPACPAMGRCYFPAFGSERDPHPCRLNYRFPGAGNSSPVDYKDTNWISHISALQDIGIVSMILRPETEDDAFYALLNTVCSTALNEGTPPRAEELRLIDRAFAPYGTTDAFYTGQTGPGLFRPASKAYADRDRLSTFIRENYSHQAERKTVPVKFYFLARAGRPVALAAEDADGNAVSVNGRPAEPDTSLENGDARIRARLLNTGGTFYSCREVAVKCDRGFSVPSAQVDEMRNEALKRLSAARLQTRTFQPEPFKPGLKYLMRKEPPELVLTFEHADQLDDGHQQVNIA